MSARVREADEAVSNSVFEMREASPQVISLEQALGRRVGVCQAENSAYTEKGGLIEHAYLGKSEKFSVAGAQGIQKSGR